MVEIEYVRDERAYVLTSSVVLPVSRATLFDFFSDAFQLETITPPWLKFRVLTSPPIHIQSGALIDYRLKLHGLPIRWRTEISTWDPPRSFTDRQLRGPYRLWEHLHTFEEMDEGTLVRDEVRYRVWGGALTNSFVKRDLLKIFGYRRQRMLELFSASPATH